MGEMVMLPIPEVLQRDVADCGPACVAAVVRGLGQRISLADATRDLLTNGHAGTDPSAIEAYLRRRGFKVLAGDMDALDLRYATRHGRPVICVTANHYVVVRGWERGRVALMDPMIGLTWEKWDDFRATWRDAHRWGVDYDQFGLQVWRP
jgi:ABC-type bacteriocin/lantibiotic exporter with double-glycine peptidase domain